MSFINDNFVHFPWNSHVLFVCPPFQGVVCSGLLRLLNLQYQFSAACCEWVSSMPGCSCIPPHSSREVEAIARCFPQAAGCTTVSSIILSCMIWNWIAKWNYVFADCTCQLVQFPNELIKFKQVFVWFSGLSSSKEVVGSRCSGTWKGASRPDSSQVVHPLETCAPVSWKVQIYHSRLAPIDNRLLRLKF